MFRPYKYVKQEVSERPKGKNDDTWQLRVHIAPLGIDFKKTLSVVLMVSGVFLVVSQIFVPWLTTPRAQKPVLKPVSSEPKVAGLQSGGVEVGFEFEFSELAHPPEESVVATKVGTVPVNPLPAVFYVSVPKLGIERAEVETNSENLSPDERLGHYAGSALPGEVGNTFIYGHSASPMFYDPKNYKTIFTTLDKLEKDDEITIEFGGKYFKYMVEKSVVLEPENVKPLETVGSPFLKKSFLTLMTCVPPGIRTKRLLVRARLVL